MASNEAPTVLIVDDDRGVQRLLADALAEEGFSVVVERDGEWAIDTFNKREVDAIVLDLLLPAISGYEVAEKVRSTPRGQSTPIIMISGVYKGEVHQKEAVEKHGAFAFLEKPVRLSDLYAALKSALGERYPSAQALADAPKKEELADPQAEEEATLVEKQSQVAPPIQGIRGDFRQRAFPEVLAEIFHWKGTGALMLRRDKVKKIAYFRDGQPQFVKSNLLSECLGKVMLRERIISESECEESLRRMKATGRRQGAILIEMGSISPHNLVYALNLQLRLKLFEVFAWTYGEYQFNPRLSPPAETVNLEMPAPAVIYEGVRTHFDVARMRPLMGNADDLFAHRSANPAHRLSEVGLGEEEQHLLELIDGRQTVAELRALELLAPLDTDRLVYAMKCGGLVELKEHPAEPPSAVPAPPEPSAGAIDSQPGENDDIPDVSNEAELISSGAHRSDRLQEISLAEAKFQLGEELLREQHFQAAHQLFQEAVDIYEGAAQFHAYLGWSQFQMDPENADSVQQALTALQKAIQLNPTMDKSYLFSGYIYKATGRPDQAEVQFEKAIQCNPDCAEALKELKERTQEQR